MMADGAGLDGVRLPPQPLPTPTYPLSSTSRPNPVGRMGPAAAAKRWTPPERTPPPALRRHSGVPVSLFHPFPSNVLPCDGKVRHLGGAGGGAKGGEGVGGVQVPGLGVASSGG